MTGVTIEAEGITWPLETFLDTHRFVRTDGQVPDFAGHPGTLDVVMLSGELRRGQEAATIPWHDVLAASAPDGSLRFSPCPICGEWVVPVSISNTPADGGTVMHIETPYCSSCQDEGEWEL